MKTRPRAFYAKRAVCPSMPARFGLFFRPGEGPARAGNYSLGWPAVIYNMPGSLKSFIGPSDVMKRWFCQIG